LIVLTYYFSRFLIRLGLPIYLKRLSVFNVDKLPKDGSMLIASNHPDSFFDALVIGSVLDTPIHTLARGDAFKKSKVAFWLRQIKLIPVFRGSEGRGNVKKLDATNKEAYEVLKSGEAVVIFSEGVCVNEWRLRPLGKGTARMAYQVWFGDKPLQDMSVIPTGVNYEHFRGPGKCVSLCFGEPIKPADIRTNPEEYEKWLREFNEVLDMRMNQQILTIPADTAPSEKRQILDRYFKKETLPARDHVVLRMVGKIGRLIHRPVYQIFEKKAHQLTKKSVFYDSVLFGLLLYLYPLLVVLISVGIGLGFGWLPAAISFLLFPTLAWVGAQYR
jgi:1-acyl-sn-glycerol-3-phosphate acyltransferase